MPAQVRANKERLRERGRKQEYTLDPALADALGSSEDANDSIGVNDLFKDLEGEGSNLLSSLLPSFLPEEPEPASELEDFEPSAELEESTQVWLRRAGRTALLTHDQEITLAKRLEAARAKGNRLEEQRAKDSLVMANLRLVASVARRYLGHGMPMEDLMQEGTIGLMRAVDRFNYNKGYRFSTYAIWWIRRSISRAIADQSRLIRLPVHVTDTLGRLNKTRSSLRERLGRTPTRAELAQAMKMTEQKLNDLLKGTVQPLSLETPIGEAGESRLADLIPATDAQNPVAEADRGALRDELELAMGDLTEREKDVIKLRYGLGGDEPRTLEEVGRALDVTRERVRQIESSAFAKLRKRHRTRRLRELTG